MFRMPARVGPHYEPNARWTLMPSVRRCRHCAVYPMQQAVCILRRSFAASSLERLARNALFICRSPAGGTRSDGNAVNPKKAREAFVCFHNQHFDTVSYQFAGLTSPSRFDSTCSYGVATGAPYGIRNQKRQDGSDSGSLRWESTRVSRQSLHHFPFYGVPPTSPYPPPPPEDQHQTMHRESADKMDAMLRVSIPKMDSNYMGEPDVAMMSTGPVRNGMFQTKSPLFRECMAEFLGMFVFMLFGTGVVAQVVLSEGTKGEFISINFCWGLGILFGIHVCGGVSGAHLNPAVTMTLALFGRFEWKKVPCYVIAQMLAAFLAAAIVGMVYDPLIKVSDPHMKTTQGIFATYPYSNDVPIGTCFMTEVVGTALLVGCLFAIGDEMNKPASPYSQPGAVALLVVAIGMAFGMNTGYAINPARDLGPRLFTLCAGWGPKVFTLSESYWWVPIVGPMLGGPIGAGLYVALVEQHHPVEFDHAGS